MAPCGEYSWSKGSAQQGSGDLGFGIWDHSHDDVAEICAADFLLTALVALWELPRPVWDYTPASRNLCVTLGEFILRPNE